MRDIPLICLSLIILGTFQVNAADQKQSAVMSIIFNSTMEDGTQVEFTVTKTGSDKGTIQEKKWLKGDDPATDEPDSIEKTKIYRITAKSDGTELVGKADVPLKDPIVIFTLNRPEDQDPERKIEKPTLTLIVKGTTLHIKDKTTIYIITEKEREDLRAFLRNAGFPEAAERK